MSQDSALRVVHVSSAHPWTDNRIHYRECASLAAAGFDVTLIAVESDTSGPVDGLTVVTLPKRSRVSRMIFSSITAVALAVRTRANVVHLHDPELVWSIPLFRLLGRKTIYDAHEDLPSQVLSKPYLSPMRKPFILFAAKAVVALSRLSHHVVAATSKIAERYPSSRTSIVHNFPPLLPSEEMAIPVTQRQPKVVYVGAISENRGAETMVDVLAAPEFPQGWRLNLAGRADSSLLQRLRDKPAWHKVAYEGEVPSSRARELVQSSRVGLVLLHNTTAHRESLPTKMFEYFASGVPVIASDFPLWRSIVEKYQCGLLVDETSVNSIVDAVLTYANDPDLLSVHSLNARRLAVERFNWGSEAETLVKAYDSIVPSARFS